MSRNVSALFRSAVYAQETAQVYTLLLTINHPDLSTPIRLSSDNASSFTFEGETVRGTVSGGNQFPFMPMEITLPDDSDEAVTKARIEVCNVNPVILDTIKGLSTPPTATIQVVLASTPSTIEATTGTLELNDIVADRLVVSASLGRPNFMGEPYPGGKCAPANFPGMF